MKPFALLPTLFFIAFGLSACATRTSYAYLYGQAAPTAMAGRTIVITPATRYVNVEGGETIRFVAGDKEFAWSFRTARTIHAFDLNEVAPPGVLNQAVRTYVAPDPRYINAPS